MLKERREFWIKRNKISSRRRRRPEKKNIRIRNRNETNNLSLFIGDKNINIWIVIEEIVWTKTQYRYVKII